MFIRLVEARARRAVALLLGLGYVLATTTAHAGCSVPPLRLWAPLSSTLAPLNSRITLTMGGYSGIFAKVIVRPEGGQALAVTERRWPGPRNHHYVLQLIPMQHLLPDTNYEVVALHAQNVHPNHYVFGGFRTGSQVDEQPPTLRVAQARPFERERAGGEMQQWIDLRFAPDAASPSPPALFGVWLPTQAGVLRLNAPPDVILPGAGNTLRLSSSGPCPASALPPLNSESPTPFRATPTHLALVAFDEAFNRSAVVHFKTEGAAERVDP